MGRRDNRRTPKQSQPPFEIPAEFERTLAAAEEEQSFENAAEDACPCGNTEFALQAFLRVVNGVVDPVPVEVDTLTCPECEREFDAVQLEGGRVVRGEFRGYAELDD